MHPAHNIVNILMELYHLIILQALYFNELSHPRNTSSDFTRPLSLTKVTASGINDGTTEGLGLPKS